MGVWTAPVVQANNTDAEYRVMIAAIRNIFAASGLVQTSDTGQVNPATAARGGSSNTPYHYEVYRFNDSLQATKPIFVKVEYGNGNPLNYFSYWLSVGTATDGAGALTGATVTGSRMQMTSALGGGTTLNWYGSGSSNRIMGAPSYNPASVGSGGCFLIERLLDDLGNPVGDGVAIAFLIAGSVTWWILRHGLVPAAQSAIALPAIGLNSHLPNVGSDLALAPHMFAVGMWRYWWPLAYRTADIVDLTQFSVENLGSTKTYLPMRYITTTMAASPATNMSLALPWE